MSRIGTAFRGRLASVVIAGDSLAACRPLSRLPASPLATLNLARGGARHADVAVQLREAPRRAALRLVVDGGREAPRIDRANAVLAELYGKHSVVVQDLNPIATRVRARLPHMTDDGLHFTPRANALWIAALRPLLA